MDASQRHLPVMGTPPETPHMRGVLARLPSITHCVAGWTQPVVPVMTRHQSNNVARARHARLLAITLSDRAVSLALAFSSDP